MASGIFGAMKIEVSELTKKNKKQIDGRCFEQTDLG